MKTIFLSAALTFTTFLGFSQKKISEGIITYSVEWQPTPQMQQRAAMFPSELTVYFKNDSSATISKSAMVNMNTILNSKTEYVRLLIDIPMRNQKLSVIFTPDNVEAMKENWPEFSLTATAETKIIGGYNAQKYSVKEKKSGKSSEAWFTKDIETAQNSLNQYFDKTYGFPLQFDSFQSGILLKATFKELKEVAVPAGSFSASKEYQEITFERLMSMMSGAR